MFSAFQTFGRLGAGARAVSAAWSPLALWPDGASTPGMWISPRTLASSFADSTGTTPVAAPGTVADTSNPVGLALDIRAGATALADPGNHMLQATSTARPLLSAYDGQTLGPGNTYDSAGYPVFQLYDGVDDGMATAAFSAGTLTSGMDCMIVVRRDSAANMICGFVSADTSKYFGVASSGYGGNPTSVGCGSPSVLVDGASITDERLALKTALTTGDFHILEYQNLDMSGFTGVLYGGTQFGLGLVGARGDILLFPSTASTADKDAARQWLADYYGVTLA